MAEGEDRKRALAELSVRAATSLDPEIRDSLRRALQAGADAAHALEVLLGDEPEADVGALGELPPGKVKTAHAFGRRLAVANVEGDLYVLDAACPHANGPLDLGELNGTTLSCPIHGFEFDVRTGACIGGDADSRVECFKVEARGGRMVVRRR